MPAGIAMFRHSKMLSSKLRLFNNDELLLEHESLPSSLVVPHVTSPNRVLRHLTYAFIALLAAQAISMNVLAFARTQAASSAESLSKPQSYTSPASTFTTRLAWDSRYMSLSHNYDHLWNASRSSATVFTGDQHEANRDDSALIAM